MPPLDSGQNPLARTQSVVSLHTGRPPIRCISCEVGGARAREVARLAFEEMCWQNACMAVQITIRNVPDTVRDILAERAAQDRQSMQEYLLGALEHLAQRPSPAQWIERVRRRKAEANTRLRDLDILGHRDADRR